MSRIFLLILTFIVFIPIAYAEEAAQALADKSDRVIIFYNKDNQEIGRFYAAFGRGYGAKLQEGDMRTPEGDYWLYPARKSDDWEFFMPIDYPNASDLMRARGAGIPLDRVGGQIGLHGTGDGFDHKLRQSFGENWTLGCIAVNNSSILAARDMVLSPIPIRIQP